MTLSNWSFLCIVQSLAELPTLSIFSSVLWVCPGVLVTSESVGLDSFSASEAPCAAFLVANQPQTLFGTFPPSRLFSFNSLLISPGRGGGSSLSFSLNDVDLLLT